MTTNTIYRVEVTGRVGTTTKFQYATKGYVTLPTHATIPNTWVDGRVIQPLLMRRDLYGQGRLHGTGLEIPHGQIVLQNSDGGLDALMNYAWDTEAVSVWAVDPANLNTERLVFKGVTEQISIDANTVTFLVRDDLYILDKALQATKYLGTGGLEGSASLAGKPKPKGYGRVWNISPVLIDPTNLIYQVSDSSITSGGGGSFEHIYDMRSELTTRGADYVSAADLQATAPTPFTWRAYPAGGMFRLGSLPAGVVTADITFDGAGGYAWFSILQLLVTAAFGTAVNYDNQINLAIATNLIGVYWTDERTCFDAIKEVLLAVNGSLHGYPNTSATRTITVSRIELPGTYTPALSLDNTNIIPGTLKKIVPSDDERGIPPWRVIAWGARNYTVMTNDQIAGSASTADRERAKTEYQKYQRDTSSLLVQYPNAPQLEFQGCNWAASIVTTDYLTSMFAGAKRNLFGVQVPLEVVDSLTATRSGGTASGPLLSSEFTLTYPRFNLNAGVRCALIGYSLDYQAQVADLLLWGITP